MERDELLTSIDRREFLRLMGASLALAGAAGCSVSPPVGEIVPYVRRQPGVVPGQPLFYATAATLGGYALGILAESREGRPTKIEGNPLHPSSLGATDAFTQASVLSLYDPDRSRDILRNGQISNWDPFLSELRSRLAAQRTANGAGLRILTGNVTSPTLARQLQAVLQQFPQATWHQWESISRDNEREGAIAALGADLETIYRFDAAEVILSLDADFLLDSPGRVRYARDLSRRRSVRDGNRSLNRLYVAEASPTVTGSAADHRFAMRASDVEGFARQVAASIGGGRADGVVGVVARDLAAQRGSSIVLAGRGPPPAVHALGHALNAALGNVGQTVFYIDPVAASPVNNLDSLRALTADLNAGRVEMLIVIGGNPAYDAPADISFGESMKRAGWSAHLGLYQNETSDLCYWHIPATHELESWSDARGHDGTATIIQPLIAPLFNGRTAHELLAAVEGRPQASPLAMVRETWLERSAGSGEPSDEAWRSMLRDGLVPNTAFTPRTVIGRTEIPAGQPAAAAAPENAVELVFRPDPTLWDGRFANNAWLQELPRPLTKLTWGNAFLMSPATARRLGVTNDIAGTGGLHGQILADTVEVSIGDAKLAGAALIVPGQADDSVTAYLGGGRKRSGGIGTGVGFNASALRRSDAMWIVRGAAAARTAERVSLACTQNSADMNGREPVRLTTLAAFLKDPEFARRDADRPDRQISLYPGWEYGGHAWGMAVDTGTCIGCNACVIACQAENNIPTVGKAEVMRGREMHWIRIDRYGTDGRTMFEPMFCQHCENAPCELVCPVEATTHSSEGLNEMTYNRCVGTRYCSNNCPYKVRRFNFLAYADFDTPLVQLQRNPQVTVRSRGVMEKCTYCVQRIQNAKIRAEVDGRELADGEIVTACQQACPTEAIVFGDVNDPGSRVAKLKREPANYGVLAELNTRPRTTYLAAVRNLNEELEA